jgi:hypothetical protein
MLQILSDSYRHLFFGTKSSYKQVCKGGPGDDSKEKNLHASTRISNQSNQEFVS